MCLMISAHQDMPEISVNYFCVENNYFIVALCNRKVYHIKTLDNSLASLQLGFSDLLIILSLLKIGGKSKCLKV